MIFGRKHCGPIEGCKKFYKQHLNECPYCGVSDAFSTFTPFNPLDWVYDLECYPNIFTAAFKHMNSGQRMFFEVSERCNNLVDLVWFLHSLRDAGCRMIGFGNVGYDYPLIHYILENHNSGITYDHIFSKSDAIIQTPWVRRFDNIIQDYKTHIQQIDLMKVHHFDNDARRTSLKMLEFNMRSQNIEDLPFTPGVPLTFEQMPKLGTYNVHDVDETEKFMVESIEMIEFRENMGKKYNRNFLNHSDKKIGTDLFIHELEENIPGSCYTRDPISNRKITRQTIRPSIKLADVIFPYIKFKEPEFERVKLWLSSQIITETKGVFTDLTATIKSFKYVFGAGGIHGSIDSSIVYSDNDHILVDWDVGGYYPTLGSVNKLFPEHLSEQFCIVDQGLAEQRKQYKKGTALNNAIKLARNGAYGDSNNKYSPFFDSQYTMSITINGQLLLCMLAQYLIDIPGLTMIQINTDGLTVRCPRKYIDQMNTICKWWENYTCLTLENVNYKRMFIRDVNNYIGEYEDGKLKSKGAYVYKTKQSQGSIWTPNDMDWHQNYSALVVAMAAEAALVHGQDIGDFIRNHTNIFDFMLRTKVNRADQLMISDVSGNEIQLQNITRYYIANQGGSLTKISLPAKKHVVGEWKRATKLADHYYNQIINELRSLSHAHLQPHELDVNGLPWDCRINTKNMSKYIIRRTSVNAGRLVAPCNDIRDADRSNINFDYYIAETHKLVDPLRGV